MYGWSKLNKNESGQAALEAAIILIAFVVVASVFAFAILSAGSASTEKGEQAIYAGLAGVQSSMEVKGVVTAEDTGANGSVNFVTFSVALVAGGDPVNLADGFPASPCVAAAWPVAPKPVVVIAYHDNAQAVSSLPFCVTWVTQKDGALITDADDLLEEGELADIKVDLLGILIVPADATHAMNPALGVNHEFTLEVKPPTGGNLQINRTTPPALALQMQLR